MKRVGSIQEKHPDISKAAIVSIHDLMPETLPRVEEIVSLLQSNGIYRFTLLVVPGRDWTSDHLERLTSWQAMGAELAGHGWRHRAVKKKNLGHLIHAKLISRNEAEHLSLSKEELSLLVRNCYTWFELVGLSLPVLYVPPAWAMGKVPRSFLSNLHFRLFETVSGIFDVGAGRFHFMPMTGYMADTPGRKVFLQIANIVNLSLPLRPIRIAIHPQDLYLSLYPDLLRHLAKFSSFITYKDFLNHITCLD